MKLLRVALALLLSAPLLLSACAEDDGAQARESGSVVIIGPPPPGGGGSVSAVGTGCTTSGASTKVPAADVQVALDEYTLTLPQTVPAGVTRLVVKNFGSDPHELVIARADSAEALPVTGGVVDIEALAGEAYRVREFPGNTICEGTFELPPGRYVAFSNLAGPDGSDYARGMVATFVVA